MRGSIACISASLSCSSPMLPRRSRADQLPRHVMGLAERQPEPAHQPVGEVGRGGVAGAGRFAHASHVGLEIAHHAGHGREAQRQRLQRVERAFLVLLHVLGIGERQALHDDQQACSAPRMRPALAAHEFGGIGIALLRHDRGAGRERVRQPDEAELRRRPQHDLFGEAREMHGADRGRRERLQREVAVGRRCRANWRSAGRSRARAAVASRSIGKEVPASAAAPSGLSLSRARASREAAAVAGQHLDVGEEMVAEGHRLRRLQMGEARHHRAGVGERLLGQRPLQVGDLRVERVDRVAHPEPEIERDLVVARARGVQPPGIRADDLGQPRLDVHVDVFERAREREAAALDFAANSL